MSTKILFRTPCLFLLLFFTTMASAGQHWEYLVKTYPLLGNDQALTQVLNKLGTQRWALVNCTEGDAQLTCIFKRSAADSQHMKTPRSVIFIIRLCGILLKAFWKTLLFLIDLIDGGDDEIDEAPTDNIIRYNYRSSNIDPVKRIDGLYDNN